jgi:hypothetical protein
MIHPAALVPSRAQLKEKKERKKDEGFVRRKKKVAKRQRFSRQLSCPKVL